MLRFHSVFLAALTVLLPSCLDAKIVPPGTCLEARLAIPTGSRISHPGDPVSATLIAPVYQNGELLIPSGSIISGVIASVQRLGLGIKHVTAKIEYRFNVLTLLGGIAVPIQAQVVQVETAKERVNAQGVIGGIYPLANASSNVALYTLPLIWVDPELGIPLWGIKMITARSPDPEIYFPAGTELLLKLTVQSEIPVFAPDLSAPGVLSAIDFARVQQILARIPQWRTRRGHDLPSDYVNLLFLGTRDSIGRAFAAAGWSGAERNSMKTIYRLYHCMEQRMGYRTAPMDRLTLNGALADADYQKSLDTFSKRHHVRLWKQDQEDVWLSAATEDVSYKLRNMHLTHATDPLIDNERSKVLNDLAFTGCVDSGALVRQAFSDRGDPTGAVETDGRLVVLRLNDCYSPRGMPPESSQQGIRGRRSVEALLALRNDLIRTNPASLVLNTVIIIQAHQESRAHQTSPGDRPLAAVAGYPRSPLALQWLRPSVLDATIGAQAAGGQAGYQ